MTYGLPAESVPVKPRQPDAPRNLRVRSEQLIQFSRKHLLKCLFAKESPVPVRASIRQHLSDAGQVVRVRPRHCRAVDGFDRFTTERPEQVFLVQMRERQAGHLFEGLQSNRDT